MEFFYPAVKREFVRQIEEAEFDTDRVRENTSFEDWFFYREGLLLAEHGHLYDPLNCFMYPLDPRLPVGTGVIAAQQDHIDLPWGSQFVRYFFNRLESEHPFSDNIRPSSQFVFWLLRHRPFLAVRYFLRDGHHLVSKLRRAWRRMPDGAYAARKAYHEQHLEEMTAKLLSESKLSLHQISQNLQKTTALHAISIFRNTRGAGMKFLHGLVKLGYPGLIALFALILLAILGVSALIVRLLVSVPLLGFLFATLVLSLVTIFLVWIERPPRLRKSRCARAAAELQRIWNVRYVAMGHTHFSDYDCLENGAAYFNTGTWTRLFEYPPMSVLPEENELVFLEITFDASATPTARLLRWIDASRSSRPVKLFN